MSLPDILQGPAMWPWWRQGWRERYHTVRTSVCSHQYIGQNFWGYFNKFFFSFYFNFFYSCRSSFPKLVRLKRLKRKRCYQPGSHKATEATGCTGLYSISACVQATTVFVSPSCICVAMLYLCEQICIFFASLNVCRHVVFVSPLSICVVLLCLCCHVVFVLPICICVNKFHKGFLDGFPKKIQKGFPNKFPTSFPNRFPNRLPKILFQKRRRKVLLTI